MRKHWNIPMAAAAAVLCSCLFLSGCGNTFQPDEEKLQIVCTIFPEYDWTRRIVGDTQGVEVTLLVKNGADLHSYQPSVQDIAAIAQADLFCYVGGTSDQWVRDVLQTAGNQSIQVVSMLEAADAQEEITVEGMQAEEHHHAHEEHDEEHDDDHHDDDHDHEEEEAELDEHVWLSLRRAQMDCQAICDALCELDEANAQQYRDNCNAYTAQLQALDESFTQKLEQQAMRSTILVADRFPFRYLAEDYGLTYSAAFPGCSAETEASFETIVFLAQQVQNQQLPCIFETESSNGSLAKTVLESADSSGTVLTLNSMQAVTEKQIQQGTSYLSLMEENLNTLLQGLSMQ